MSTVSVTIVTYNSRRYIDRCLDAVLRQSTPPLEIIVVDNASTDGTLDILDSYQDRIQLACNDRNLGFAVAQNQAIDLSSGKWVLTLNPDVILLDGFLERLLEAARTDPAVGSLCGKLLAIGKDLSIPASRRLDSAGIYFTPSMRHFDRGWSEPDDGRYDKVEYVFGATAAAALYRRAMIDDISYRDGFFDPDFFMYREDADVAWRAQLMGWHCLYTPHAVAYHVRSVAPANRRRVPAHLNMHSVKNRFLMRIKNVTSDVYRRCWLAATARDLLVIGGCLLWEPTSLPAFWHFARSLHRAIEHRREILSRRAARDLARWFRNDPVTLPAAQPSRTLAYR